MTNSSAASGFEDPEELCFFAHSLEGTLYDPEALAASKLRQPVPRDLPPHLDASVFTFKDAFEDLLATSQGKTIPDIESRHLHSKMMRQMYPNGESHAAWLRRLQTQDLICFPSPGAFARRLPMGLSAFMYDGLDRDAEALRLSLHQQEELEMAAEFGRKLREMFRTADNDGGPKSPTEQQKRQPDHFDDLFSALTAATHLNGSWEAFKKSFAGDDESKLADSNDAVGGKPQPGDEVSKWVDWLGYTHTTVKRKILDKDGNVVGTERHTHIGKAPEDDTNSIENSDVSDADSKKKSGWFR